MRRVLVIIFALGLIVTLSSQVMAKGEKKEKCTTIQSGELFASDSSLIETGYDMWGYNYRAHMFNGYYCDAYRDAAWCQPYKEDTIGHIPTAVALDGILEKRMNEIAHISELALELIDFDRTKKYKEGETWKIIGRGKNQEHHAGWFRPYLLGLVPVYVQCLRGGRHVPHRERGRGHFLGADNFLPCGAQEWTCSYLSDGHSRADLTVGLCYH